MNDPEGRKMEETWRERLRDGRQKADGTDMDAYTDELQRRIDAHPKSDEDAQVVVKHIQIALNEEIGLRR